MGIVVNPQKPSGGGGGGVSHHEALSGLQGGRSGEHYHLTKEQYDKFMEFFYPSSLTVYDGGTASTTQAEYDANQQHWLNGGYAPNDHAGGVDGGGAAG